MPQSVHDEVIHDTSVESRECKESPLKLQRQKLSRKKANPLERHRIRYISEVSHDGFGSLIIHPSVVDHCGVTSDDDVIKPRVVDGGYSWVILGAAFLSFLTNGFQFGSFSVMYIALVEYFKADRGTIGWIGSLYNFSGNFFGLLLGSLVQKYGCRAVTSVGAAVGAAGIALSSLLVNIPYLYFTYGVLGGIGNGMVFLSSFVMLQRYFNKRRAMAIAIGASGLSVGSVTAVSIANWLLKVYGLGGAYLILGGVFLHNFVSAALFKPLKVSTRTLVVENDESLTAVPTPNDDPDELENNPDTLNTGGHTIYKDIGTKNECGEQRISDDKSVGSSKGKSPKKSLVKDLIDFSPLKEPKLLLLTLATLLYNIGAVPFFAHYMSRMVHLGFERQTAVNFQTCMAFSTLVSRLAWGFVGNLKRIDRITLYGVLVFIGAFVVLTFAFVHHPVAVAIYGILHGLTSGGYFSLQPTVLVDIVGVEFIAKTTGLMNMTISTSILIGIPLAGFVYDVTGSYDYPYIVIGCIQAVGGALLILLDVLLRRRCLS